MEQPPKDNPARGLLKILGVLILFYLSAALFLPTYVGGKPTTRGLAQSACKAYLDYAKHAATNSEFRFDSSTFLKYANTNYNFSRAGISYFSTTGLTNEAVTLSATRHVELYNSCRAIFNTNQDFWARTNFFLIKTNREPVIVCKQPFYFPRPKNYFGCSFSRLKPAFCAGFSDGTTALISQEEFSGLNLNRFVPLSSLGVEGFHARFNQQ